MERTIYQITYEKDNQQRVLDYVEHGFVFNRSGLDPTQLGSIMILNRFYCEA